MRTGTVHLKKLIACSRNCAATNGLKFKHNSKRALIQLSDALFARHQSRQRAVSEVAQAPSQGWIGNRRDFPTLPAIDWRIVVYGVPQFSGRRKRARLASVSRNVREP